MTSDLDTATLEVTRLEPRERSQRWAHLSLCVIDAVFSIGARYETTTRTVHRYAWAAGLLNPLVDNGSAHQVIGTENEERLSQMLARANSSDGETWADQVLENRQRTSPRGGVLKADAVRRYAEVLVRCGVERFEDAWSLMTDDGRMAPVESELARVPGHGAHGVRLGYLWMLVGDDRTVKPDRMMLRWIGLVLGRQVAVPEARSLVYGVAQQLDVTPWAVDHAIWADARGRRGR